MKFWYIRVSIMTMKCPGSSLTETVESGWNILVGHETSRIVQVVHSIALPNSRPPLYGDGAAAEKCVELLGFGAEPVNSAERTEYANSR